MPRKNTNAFIYNLINDTYTTIQLINDNNIGTSILGLDINNNIIIYIFSNNYNLEYYKYFTLYPYNINYNNNINYYIHPFINKNIIINE